MRQGFAGVLLLVFMFAAGILASVTLFDVDQTQQALVLRFGEPVPDRGLITEPGLHAKMPFFENVVWFSKRILNVDSGTQELIASDNQRLQVDAFALYHIVDPLLFYQTVGTEARADNQLESILNSAVRRVLGEANQQQIVREDRAALMHKIREQVEVDARKIGVSINDVRIRHADFPPEISEKVFSRMQSERAREAAEYRAQGSEQAQTIRAKADRDVVVLGANAQEQANILRGQGEAERNAIYVNAISGDPEFFAFFRSLQAYESAFKPNDTRFVLDPKSAFFRYFNSLTGSPVPAAAAQGEAK